MSALPFDGAKLALLVRDRVLVLQRDDNPAIPFPGQWDLPGGGREGGETPEDCALRETREELALDLAAAAIHWRGEFPGVLPGQVRTWFFVIRDDGFDPARVGLGDEGRAWALMEVAEYLAHPRAVRHMADRLRAYLDAPQAAGHRAQ